MFLCNRPTQGGGLKRQLDKVLSAMDGKTCFMLRASDFPPNRRTRPAQAFRKFRDGGGRQFLVPIPEWERMMMVREFYTHHRNDPGFVALVRAAPSCCPSLLPLAQLLRLDLLGFGAARPVGWQDAADGNGRTARRKRRRANGTVPHARTAELEAAHAERARAEPRREEDELPLSVILDENGGAGRASSPAASSAAASTRHHASTRTC